MSTVPAMIEGDARAWPLPLKAHSSAAKRLVDCAAILKKCVKDASRDAGQPNYALAWLVDNYSYLLFQIRETSRSLRGSYLRRLPTTSDGELRIHKLASDLLAGCDEVIDLAALTSFPPLLAARETLMLGELWIFSSMLKLVLLERLCHNRGSERIVSLSIRSLRALDTTSWERFVESVSAVQRVLEQDPAGIYSRMDFVTRDRYRQRVEQLARRSKLSEKEVAEKALACAAAAEAGERKGHVGYYLVDPSGYAELASLAGFKPGIRDRVCDAIQAWPNLFYVSCCVLLTALIAAAFDWFTGRSSWWIALLLLIPASQAALEMVNALISRILPPRMLPSMDFSDGIPAEAKTLVVVPTLLGSIESVDRLLEDLEIRYLANRETNLYFALLTDFTDAGLKEMANDRVLGPCAEGIRRLNMRYGAGGAGPFYLFHRARTWNSSECRWMGYERKRGKLNDLNRLLLDRGNSFDTVVGDLSRLAGIRFVITLDTDTQLPRDTAAKMIGAAAHPLNRPVLDSETGRIKTGYAIISPRVAVSMESAGRSRLSQIFNSDTGFDPYATSVSDVYQDLHGQASFVGKGIYDLRAFHAAAGDRFPENSILSHDLIEGEFARTSLLTSVELVEGCPSTYEGFTKRKHRWVRGDWQLLPWLLARIPGSRGERAPNPLSFLSRWKIFDNLRRSLNEISILLLFAAGWLVAEDMTRWTIAVLGLLLLAAYTEFLFIAASAPERRFWPSFAGNFSERFLESHRNALLNLVLIPHQALVMSDAIVRTLVRRFVTRRNLLEWETMADAETAHAASSSALNGSRLTMVERYLCFSALGALLMWLALANPVSLAGLVCAIWIAAPLVIMWLNQPLPSPAALVETDRRFLRGVALRTWRFFADQSGPHYNWLVPDNIQLSPPLEAHRVSPTNMGLLLSAHLAAHDFGYTTTETLATTLARTLDSFEKMPRCHGHFFNWYDTRTLSPEPPKFISTVDSGNLAAALCSIRQGCLSLLKQPVIGQAVLDGLRDHAARLREEVPYAARSGGLMRPFASLVRQLESHPADLFFWEGVLTDARETIKRLRESLERTHSRLRKHGDIARSEELEYWESLLAERLESALHELYSLAPWLDPALEPELRLNSRDASLAPLFADLCAIPSLAELPAVHDRIEAHVRARFDSAPALYPALRSILEELLRRLPAAKARARQIIDCLKDVAWRCGAMVEGMDFAFLFDRQKKLLRIGYDADTDRLAESSYDLLASEARTAVFLAIAKGDIPRDAWFRLGRKLTAYRNERSLVSWSGTMFEYLMPMLYMRSYASTLLDGAVRGAVRIQQRYAAQRGVPWGISEAAHAGRDGHMQYQYRAFGVPALSANPQRSEALVVAPYASMLALQVDPRAAASNLRVLAAQGALSRYGFFESLDYSSRSHSNGEMIHCFMAHHQGMALLAIGSALLGERMQERFHQDPAVQATEFLLQERMPALVETLTNAENVAA